MERRYLPSLSGLTVRSEGEQPVIEGYGAVFYDASDPGTEYELYRDVYERISRGAFDRAIREDRVRSLFNHDANFVLGSNRGNEPSLTLTPDSKGLRYTVRPPNTQLIRDAVIEPIQRGDVDGSSFMFVPRKVAWIEETRGERTVDVREIQEVELWEVGPVTFPAYQSTTTGIRAADGDLASIRRELEAERRKRSDVWEWESVRVRLARMRARERAAR